MSGQRWPGLMHRSALLRSFHAFLVLRLTPVGRVSFLLLLCFGLGGAASLEIPLYIPWAFFFLLMMTAILSSVIAVPKKRAIRVQRMPVPNGSVGAELSYEIELENLSSRPLYHFEITEWLLPFWLEATEFETLVRVERLEPGEKKKLRLKVRCVRRGAYQFTAVGVLSAFPLGIWRGMRRHRQASPFLVYPAFRRLEHFEVPTGQQYQRGGILLSSEVGESAEFMHTREYREGDNPRHIHWASWARRGEPVVKVYQQEYFVRLALLLDSERCEGFEEPAFEAAISVAASIADALSRRDYIIDLFAAGEDLHHFQAGRSLAHLEHILEILACVDSSPAIQWQALQAALAPQAAQFSALVMIVLDWDARRKELVERLGKLGLSCRVIVVRAGATSLPVPADLPHEILQIAPDDGIAALATPALEVAP